MKARFIIATAASGIISFGLPADSNSSGKPGKYEQDTPKIDSAKHHLKTSKKIKINKDSVKKTKKDTV